MSPVDKGFRSSVAFPPAEKAMEEGLVAVGGRVDVGTLYHAYTKGIFPWPQEGLPMLWFSPEQRGVLFFEDLKIPRRAKDLLRPPPIYRFSQNEAFGQVIRACRRQPRPC